MKHLITTLALSAACLATSAFASSHKEAPMVKPAADVASPASCSTQAFDKKLAGAAKNSFMKKCERDASGGAAASVCATKAVDKKLAGAAKNSFMKKCERESAKV